jgi:phage major head subunit gpT-like protein
MSTLLRTNLTDLYLEDALPALHHIVDDEWQGFEPVWEKIFNVMTSDRSIEQTAQLSALAAAAEVQEGEEVPQQRIYQGYDKTYKHAKFGIIAPMSQESIDDGQFELMAKYSRKLARAFNETVMIKAAQIFNDGFSSAGPDGQVLFATAHPLLGPGAGTSSNRLGTDADLSMTSLKALLTIQRKVKDTAGNRLNIRSKKLIVPSDLEFTAHELVESEMLVDSSNNNVNAVNSVKSRYGLEVVVLDHLTDEDAWFLAADKDEHELNFFWRKQPSVSSKVEFKSEVAMMKISGRFSVGYSDWRGVAGTSGAT